MEEDENKKNSTIKNPMNGKNFKPLIDDDDHEEVLEPIITKKIKLVEYDSDWIFYIRKN